MADQTPKPAKGTDMSPKATQYLASGSVVLSALSLLVAFSAYRLNELSLRVGQRASLSPKFSFSATTSDHKGEQRLQMTTELRNLGNTPARAVYSEMDVQNQPDLSPHGWTPDIGPRDSSILVHETEVPDELWQHLQMGETGIILTGKLSYKDVFDGKHHQDLCFRYSKNQVVECIDASKVGLGSAPKASD
jgi:hypothetical protein